MRARVLFKDKCVVSHNKEIEMTKHVVTEDALRGKKLICSLSRRIRAQEASKKRAQGAVAQEVLSLSCQRERSKHGSF